MSTRTRKLSLVAAIISATQITLSQAATQTNTAQTLSVIDQPTAYDAVLVRLATSRVRSSWPWRRAGRSSCGSYIPASTGCT